MRSRLLPTRCFALFTAFILLALPTLVMAQATDAVTATDQESDGTSVVVDSVTAAAPGWMVIHIDDGGSPGPVLGEAPVAAGESSNVVVTLDSPLDGDTTLWAMLHVDEGVIGTYEFPGADVPVKDSGMVVMAPFNVTVAATETPTETSGTTEAMTSTVETGTTEAMTDTVETGATEAMTSTVETGTTEAMTDTTYGGTTEAMTSTVETGTTEAMTGTVEPGAPEVLPTTGAGMDGVAMAVPAALAALSMLAGGAWVSRRRR